MASVVYLDTHVVVWLYAGQVKQLSPRAVDAVEQNDLLISPMVDLELTYLLETNRITPRADSILADLRRRIGLRICDAPFPKVIAQASRQRWTRDPFDRIIVGHAAAYAAPLVTRDERIRQNFSGALW